MEAGEWFWWNGCIDVCVDFWWVAVVVEEDGGFWGFRHDGGVLVSECGRLGKERRVVESDLQWGRWAAMEEKKNRFLGVLGEKFVRARGEGMLVSFVSFS